MKCTLLQALSRPGGVRRWGRQRVDVRRTAWRAAFVSALVFSSAARADSLAIIPDKIVLSSPAARQQLVVERVQDQQLVGQITNDLQFTSSDTNVVRVENGVAVPMHDGRATLRAKAGRDSAKAEVIVSGLSQPFEWSFRNHVQPVLAKFGCSSGACHGAAAGKNGFKLSLRGYDDEGDFIALQRNSMGRCIV